MNLIAKLLIKVRSVIKESRNPFVCYDASGIAVFEIRLRNKKQVWVPRLLIALQTQIRRLEISLNELNLTNFGCKVMQRFFDFFDRLMAWFASSGYIVA